MDDGGRLVIAVVVALCAALVTALWSLTTRRHGSDQDGLVGLARIYLKIIVVLLWLMASFSVASLVVDR